MLFDIPEGLIKNVRKLMEDGSIADKRRKNAEAESDPEKHKIPQIFIDPDIPTPKNGYDVTEE